MACSAVSVAENIGRTEARTSLEDVSLRRVLNASRTSEIRVRKCVLTFLLDAYLTYEMRRKTSVCFRVMIGFSTSVKIQSFLVAVFMTNLTYQIHALAALLNLRRSLDGNYYFVHLFYNLNLSPNVSLIQLVG